MPNYHRVKISGGTYFFTLVTNQRRAIFLEARARQALKEAFRLAIVKYPPFQIEAICLLPDHLHCIWTFPENDDDYSSRWKAIKASFSRQYLKTGGRSGLITSSKAKKGELGIWQRRFWEHYIHDVDDLHRHIDYIHYNPVKHRLVNAVKNWPWSTFHNYVRKGYYDIDWGNEIPDIDEMMVGE